MSPITLLLADNDQEYLNTINLKLTKAGFNVILANDPAQARRILSEQNIDLAVLDLRLEDDSEGDRSGLTIAKNEAPGVPKVIVSDFGSIDAVREALGMKAVDGLPPVVRFVKKKEGFEALLEAVRIGLELRPKFQKTLSKISGKLDGYYDDARHDAQRYNWVSLAASIFGIIVIGFAAYLGLQGELTTALLTALAGMIIQAIGYLAFKRSDAANLRRDRYHSELLELHQLEILLSACSTLNAENEEKSKVKVITAAVGYWLPKGGNIQNTPLTNSEPQPITEGGEAGDPSRIIG